MTITLGQAKEIVATFKDDKFNPCQIERLDQNQRRICFVAIETIEKAKNEDFYNPEERVYTVKGLKCVNNVNDAIDAIKATLVEKNQPSTKCSFCKNMARVVHKIAMFFMSILNRLNFKWGWVSNQRLSRKVDSYRLNVEEAPIRINDLDEKINLTREKEEDRFRERGNLSKRIRILITELMIINEMKLEVETATLLSRLNQASYIEGEDDLFRGIGTSPQNIDKVFDKHKEFFWNEDGKWMTHEGVELERHFSHLFQRNSQRDVTTEQLNAELKSIVCTILDDEESDIKVAQNTLNRIANLVSVYQQEINRLEEKKAVLTHRYLS